MNTSSPPHDVHHQQQELQDFSSVQPPPVALSSILVTTTNNSSSATPSHNSDEPIMNNKNDSHPINNNDDNNYKSPHEKDQGQPQQEQETHSTTLTDAERAKMESFTFFTPRTVLLLFTLINFVIYFDRGVPAAAISYIRVDKEITGGDGSPPLTQSQSGHLYTAFMVGFFIFNPISVMLGEWVSSNKIIVSGCTAWIFAVILAGLAKDYNVLLFARAIVGVGEGCFIAFSVTVIDNIAPKSVRSYWLSLFYGTIPLGNALGIAIGGVICDLINWRAAFFLEAIPMVILVLICAFLPREYNVRTEHRRSDEDSNNSNENQKKQSSSSSHIPLVEASRLLICENTNYVLASVGAVGYTFVLGALSFFAVSMLVQSNFDVSAVQASILLGSSTSVMGLLASVAGGKIVDRMPGGSTGSQGMYNSTLVMTISIALVIPLGFITLVSSNFTMFCVFFVMTVFFVFLPTAPQAGVILGCVDPRLRQHAIAFNTLAIHLLGDSFSPGITGMLADSFDGNCNLFGYNETLCKMHILGASPEATIENYRNNYVNNNNNNNSHLIDNKDGTRLFCKFLPSRSANENSSCVNPEELFRAMRYIWMMFFFVVPLWGYLVKIYGKKAEEEKMKVAKEAADGGHQNVEG